MAKFLSDRQQSLRVGISSYTESSTVLQTIGNVGIGTTNAGGRSLYVIGNTEVTGISTLGVTTATNLTSRQLNVSGISTLGVTTATNLTSQRLIVSGISTFSNGPVLIGSATSTGTVDQDLQVTGGAYVSGSIGIGTTNPTSTLSVVGNGNFIGIVSATSFFGSGQNLTDLIAAKIGGLEVKNENVSIGAASSFSSLNFIGDYVNAVGVGSTANITFSNPGFASTAGIATNLKGGIAGNVPYQSAPDTTTFVTNGSPGQVLLFNGTIPIWSNVSAASGSFGGISIQDESTPVGTANSVTTLNFRGSNVVVTATTGANGIATITVADNLVGTGLSISGISTLGVTTSTNLTSQQLNVSGISTLGVTTATNLTSQRLVVSGISTLGVASITQISAGGTTGQNSYVLSSTGTGLSWQPVTSVGGGVLNGIIVQEEGSTVGTAGSITTLNFVGNNITASAVALGVAATITVSNTPTFNSLVISGISTLGVTSTTNLTSQQLNISGLSTFRGITTYTAPLFGTQANFAGVVTATDFNSTSDVNLKKDIIRIENSLETVEKLNGVKFTWKSSDKKSIGVIAQEVEKVLPELVSQNETKSVNYNGIIGVLIEAVKELSAEVQELSTELQELKSQINK